MSLGIAMNGLEDRVLRCARDVASHFDDVTYVEIGVAEGETMSAIASTLRDSGKRWRAIGIELPNGYSFNRQRTEQFALIRAVPLNFVIPNSSVVHPEWGVITVYLKDSHLFLTEDWQQPIHFAMIDGCHGKPCVMLDFLALERFMVPGGIIMFHDFGEDERGQFQPHCSSGVDVRGACHDLGLMDGKRTSWKYMDTFVADKSNGGWDMGLFQKI